MAAPQLPDPVKLFVAVMWRDPSALADAIRLMEQSWGLCDYTGPDRKFDLTDYYEQEMGSPLVRRIVAFRDLISADTIVDVKLQSNAIEESLRGENGRRVNLDAGYLDHNKIVLASVKFAGQKIYLGRGIYADLVARYAHGRYQPFEWTFPDFKDGRYDEELGELRRRYLEQSRTARK